MAIKGPDRRLTKQFILYTIVGISSTGVQYLAYLCALFLSKSYDCGLIAGFLCSVFYSFFVNRCLVFPVEEGGSRNFWKSLLKTYLMYSGTGVILTGILMHLLIGWCGVSEYLAPIVIVILIYPLNFLLSKLWAYRSDPS